MIVLLLLLIIIIGFEIKTDWPIPVRRSDLFLVNKIETTCQFEDFIVLAGHQAKKNVKDKFQNLFVRKAKKQEIERYVETQHQKPTEFIILS